MNPISLLVSINKLSLIAFLVTFAFLGYEFFLLQKERKKGFKIKIPNFKVGKNYNKNKVVTKKGKPMRKTGHLSISFGLLFLIVFGGMVIVGYLNSNRVKNSQGEIKKSFVPEQTRLVLGKGIVIYSLDWRLLSVKQLAKMRNGFILIGIDKTGDKSIQMARIRVNADKWQKENITSNYNKRNNVFYIKYKIKPSDKQLKIEAQLFSKSDGWLGE